MFGVDHADHRLKRHQVLDPARAVSRLLLQLPRRGLRRLLALINQTARQLPAPAVLHEPMPPHQQHPLLVVQQRYHRRPLQPHHVMPEPLPTRQLDIYLPEPHPRIVVDRPLTERLPPARAADLFISHISDANASHGRRLRSTVKQDPQLALATNGPPRWRQDGQTIVQMTYHQAAEAAVDRPFFREQSNHALSRQDAARQAELGTYRA